MGLFITSLIANCQWGRITRTCHQRPRRPGMRHPRALYPKGAPPRLPRRAQDPSAPRKSAPPRKALLTGGASPPNGVPLAKDSLHRKTPSKAHAAKAHHRKKRTTKAECSHPYKEPSTTRHSLPRPSSRFYVLLAENLLMLEVNID